MAEAELLGDAEPDILEDEQAVIGEGLAKGIFLLQSHAVDVEAANKGA